MYEISEKEIKRKIEFQNPWWEIGEIDKYLQKWTPRAYLKLFFKLLEDVKTKRAIVLMGPRRVGKTVMIYHSIQRLIKKKIKPKNIFYFSIEDPNYSGMPLEKLLHIALEERLTRNVKGLYVFFDEIQYLKGWERHLKSLVDQYRGIKFVASGSAAAALKLKSNESGAGRFTDFLLPPLTFYEYLKLINKDDLFESKKTAIKLKNQEFINYLNYGGYPEALFSEEIQRDPGRYIRSDIIDKVLLRDLPNLYGISDIRELNRLFTALAYNTANEVSLDELSKNSSVSKATIKRYIEYLEASFLIKKLPRIDHKAKKFKREMTFKVHLTNPSMRCALFGPVDENSEVMGHLVETAIFSQMLHSSFINDIYYARWPKGEVDIVVMERNKPAYCIEIKWSDIYTENPSKLKSLIAFVEKFDLIRTVVTTKTSQSVKEMGKRSFIFTSTCDYCYRLGKGSLERKKIEDYLKI